MKNFVRLVGTYSWGSLVFPLVLGAYIEQYRAKFARLLRGRLIVGTPGTLQAMLNHAMGASTCVKCEIVPLNEVL